MDAPEKSKGKLRTGFTTGTCATAASKAGILAIINQQSLNNVDVILPKRDKINIQINSCNFSKDNAQCSVIKDGGDDPDVTHGAEIVVDLELTSNPNSIEIDGGEGGSVGGSSGGQNGNPGGDGGSGKFVFVRV